MCQCIIKEEVAGCRQEKLDFAAHYAHVEGWHVQREASSAGGQSILEGCAWQHPSNAKQHLSNSVIKLLICTA